MGGSGSSGRTLKRVSIVKILLRQVFTGKIVFRSLKIGKEGNGKEKEEKKRKRKGINNQTRKLIIQWTEWTDKPSGSSGRE